MSKKTLASKGFTLIELMIVVAIIGILAAVAIPKFADLVTKSKEASVKANLGAVRSAVSIYYGDQDGTNPTNLYTGLTSEGKYLSGQSLGNFSMPINNQDHPGHDHPQVRETKVYQTAALLVDETKALTYVNGGSRNGEVMISCGHLDLKESNWSSY